MAYNQNQLPFYIDPLHLTPEELQYERDIRPATGDTPGAGTVTTEAGAIARRMEQERANQIDPISIAVMNESDAQAIDTELNTCVAKLSEIRDTIESQAVLAAARISPTEAPGLASRLKHYDYRIKRLPHQALSAEQKILYEKATRTVVLGLHILSGLLKIDENGTIALIGDITMSSFRSERRPDTPHSAMMSSTINEQMTATSHVQTAPAQSTVIQAHVHSVPADLASVTSQTLPGVTNTGPIYTQTAPALADPHSTQNTINSNRIQNAMDYMRYDAQQQFGAGGVTFSARPNTIHHYNDTFGTNWTLAPSGQSGPQNEYAYEPPRVQQNQYAPPTFRASAQNNNPNTIPTSFNPLHIHAQSQQFQNRQSYQPRAYNRQGASDFRVTQPAMLASDTYTVPNNQLPQQQQQQHPQTSSNLSNGPITSAPSHGIPVQAPSAQHGSVYHPATTPFPQHFQEDPLNLNNLPRGQLRNARDENNAMNPCQAQQYLGRMLSNRRYEGYVNENNKQGVPLEEFIGLIRQYQASTGTTDHYVLDQVATYMTGKAFAWWDVNRNTVHSIADLEQKLRARFERQATDDTSILIDFASRKQGKDEDLLDYIDEMRQRFIRCSAQVHEWKAVEIIVNNANESHNSILAARVYDSLEHLTQHAVYLMRGKAKKNPNVFRYEKKPMPYRQRVSMVEEAHENENESQISESMIDEPSEADDETTQLVEQLVCALRKDFKPRSARPSKKLAGHPTQTDSKGPHANKTEIYPIICTNCMKWGHSYLACGEPKVTRCYGCGQEGVMKPNCSNCNGNASSKNE